MLVSWTMLSNVVVQLFLIIDSALYSAVAWLYGLFLNIARTEFFNDAVYNNFAQRIYVILGIIMLFVLAYSLLKAIVDPDSLSKGDKSFSKLAKNLVISLIIIGLLPTIFTYARNLQNYILQNDLIGVLLFGTGDTNVQVCDENGNDCKIEVVSAREMAQGRIDSYGGVLAATTLNAFLNPDNINFEYDAGEFTAEHGQVNLASGIGCAVGVAGAVGAGVVLSGATVATGGAAAPGLAAVLSSATPSLGWLAAACLGTGFATNMVADKVSVEHYTWDHVRSSMFFEQKFTQIVSLANVFRDGAKEVGTGKTVEPTYLFPVSSICAGVLIYLLISFCLDLGIRTIRLAFLQLIAPIPIIMRAMPGKSSQFDKWLKKTLATYMEVFIRVFLMYMAVYLLSNLNINTNTWQGLWVKAIVIMGVIAFVREAPKLISDITGIDSGNMKLGILPKLAAGGALTGAALIGGGATALARNAVHGVNNVRGILANEKLSGVQKGVQATGAVFRGIGSTLTGGISGAARGGYSARGAKNIADVTKGARSGAQGATAARDRREAYRIAHPEGVAYAQVTDFFHSVGDWASGGFEAQESRLKSLNDLLSAQDRAKAETEKIIDKYGTNINLKAHVNAGDYKGVDAAAATEFTQLTQNMNLASIKNMVDSLQKTEIQRSDYTREVSTGVRDASGNLIMRKVFDEAAYTKAVADYQSKVADYNSMYNQLRKASIKHVQGLVYDSAARATANLSEKDITAIKMEMDKAKDMLTAMGRGDSLNLEVPSTDTAGAGINFDSVLGDIEQERNNLAAEVARRKAERDARQNNGGNK